MVSDISNTFYAHLARQFEDLVAAHGYSVIICSTDEDVEKEQRLITMSATGCGTGWWYRRRRAMLNG